MIETSEVRVDLGEHGLLGIPYVNVVGEAGEGPHLTVIAGVHGTEYASIAAARQLLAELRPAELSGTVTVAPVINLPAFWARTPFVVPLDGKNLNRSFPGDADGSAAERIAAAVTERLIKGSDYVIDLHAGDLPEALEPFVFYDASPVEGRARELALAYGAAVVRRPDRDRQHLGRRGRSRHPVVHGRVGGMRHPRRRCRRPPSARARERPAPAAPAPRRCHRVRPPGRARRMDLDEDGRRRMVAARGRGGRLGRRG
jgi:predicted deacylase